MGNVAGNVVYGALLLTDFTVDHHEILQSARHIGLVGLQRLLLLTYLFLHGGPLVLQSFDRSSGGLLGLGLFLGRLLRGRARSGLLGSGLLALGGQRKRQQTEQK